MSRTIPSYSNITSINGRAGKPWIVHESSGKNDVFPLTFTKCRKRTARTERVEKSATNSTVYALRSRMSTGRLFSKGCSFGVSVEKPRPCQLSVESNGKPIMRKLECLSLSLSLSLFLYVFIFIFAIYITNTHRRKNAR